MEKLGESEKNFVENLGYLLGNNLGKYWEDPDRDEDFQSDDVKVQCKVDGKYDRDRVDDNFYRGLALLSELTDKELEENDFYANFDDFFKCKYIFERISKFGDRDNCKQSAIKRSRSSNWTSKISIDENVQFDEKCEISNAKSEVPVQDNTKLTCNIFHLSVFSSKEEVMERLMENIFDQVIEDIKNGNTDNEYILRNLETALTEKVHFEDVNSYMNGMNILHFCAM